MGNWIIWMLGYYILETGCIFFPPPWWTLYDNNSPFPTTLVNFIRFYSRRRVNAEHNLTWLCADIIKKSPTLPLVTCSTKIHHPSMGTKRGTFLLVGHLAIFNMHTFLPAHVAVLRGEALKRPTFFGMGNWILWMLVGGKKTVRCPLPHVGYVRKCETGMVHVWKPPS